MAKQIKIFYDLETTGVKDHLHSIHQLAGLIEIDGEVMQEFDFKVQPHPKAKIDPIALSKCGVTEEQIRAYPPMSKIHKKFIKMLGKYIDMYDSKQKASTIGFNNRAFDDNMLRAWFLHNKDDFFGSWFWSDSLDTLVIASQYLLERRASMPSFKLHRVAKELGLEVDDSRLHDALYDIQLTRLIYRIVVGLDIEI